MTTLQSARFRLTEDSSYNRHSQLKSNKWATHVRCVNQQEERNGERALLLNCPHGPFIVEADCDRESRHSPTCKMIYFSVGEKVIQKDARVLKVF